MGPNAHINLMTFYLRAHRERYFEADAFQKFYRDNTSAAVIKTFWNEIHFGIRDKLKAATSDTLARVEAVMSQAAIVSPAGPLAKYAYVPVKQGVCHHLVSDDEISWKAP
jgi:ABC-3C protein